MTGLRITDHAVLRYLERVGGFEIERLRTEMARRIAMSGPGQVGRDGEICITIDAAIFVLRTHGGVQMVTTVLTQQERRAQQRLRRYHERDIDDV